MPKWIGNRFGSIVPIAPGTDAPSAIYNIFDQYYSKRDGGWAVPTGLTATGGVVSDYIDGSDIYRAHVFTSSGSFVAGQVSVSSSGTTVTVKTCTKSGCGSSDQLTATISVD